MSSVALVLAGVIVVCPVVITGLACESIGESVQMQDIAMKNMLARRKRWSHL